MANHPEWAAKHRKPGTELRFINGKYYLYEVTSKWNSEKKRSQKITGKLIGRITKEDGFIESDKAKLRKRELIVSKLCVKEFGICAFINNYLGDYVELLAKYFPQHSDIILTLAYCRLIYQSPLKNAEFHYLHSYLSETYPNLPLSSKNLTTLMREIGVQRNRIVAFFHEFNFSDDNIIFDGTDIFCNSKQIDAAKFSKSKSGTFDFVANIMFAFSIGLQLPIYYRIIPGSIKDIKAFKLCLEESNIKDAVVIADKGFYSKDNINSLNQEALSFIIPLKRNNILIDYSNIVANDKKHLKFFMFENRVIWYYTLSPCSETLNVYVDDELKTEEIKDYLRRTASSPETYDMEKFHDKQHCFGTISLLHNLNKNPEQVFIDYKSRGQIENMIDNLKNAIEADRSYMHNEQSLEAWMFINFIALHWFYKILQVLKDSNLNKKYSPMDFLKFLSEVKKVKINDKWYLAEITKKNADALKAAGIHIT
jgi:transposase